MKIISPIITSNTRKTEFLILKELKLRTYSGWEKAFLVCDTDCKRVECYLASDFNTEFSFKKDSTIVVQEHCLSIKHEDCQKWFHTKSNGMYSFITELWIFIEGGFLSGVLYRSVEDDESYVRDSGDFTASFTKK
ncbi:hypothetical protein B9J93_20890 [Vibrio sp. V17_P4S1T151]|uniref:hypothetical protein n=1 Tax=unclassified Vibrio TaxID=2614977 RepID=UPI000B8EB60B|nr:MULTISPECIES: hypothetical protein [unclassified Vibrio]OXX40978.1 hypothetical protein B9J93_20890 [Vibrio sp. V17_P4S1T151]OXX64764.1 hypothetical protein B9J89_02525 [Vibrio sp. V15_P4S5T153]